MAPKQPIRAPSTRISNLAMKKAEAVAAPMATNKYKRAEQVEPPAKRLHPAPKSSQAKPPPPKAKAVAKPKAAPKAKPAPKRGPILTQPPTERLKVFQCGTGENSELGLGPKAKIVKRPRLNGFFDIAKVGVVAIAYGGMHGAALTHDGKVYTWGVNDQGALGRTTKAGDEDENMKDAGSDDEDSEDVLLNEDESTPKLVEFPKGTIITRIACSDSATIAVTETGLVYGWGTFRVGNFLTNCLLSLLTNLFSDQGRCAGILRQFAHSTDPYPYSGA
jgi:regulator of chromosome condensation